MLLKFVTHFSFIVHFDGVECNLGSIKVNSNPYYYDQYMSKVEVTEPPQDSTVFIKLHFASSLLENILAMSVFTRLLLKVDHSVFMLLLCINSCIITVITILKMLLNDCLI